MYRLILHKKASKFIKTRTSREQKIIFSKLDLLIDSPKKNSKLDIKKMKSLENVFRLRIGKIRIIYQIVDQELLILIISAGARGDVYKKG